LSWLTPVISATQEAEIGRIAVQGQPRQKISKNTPQQINMSWSCMTNIPAMSEAEGKGSHPSQLGQKMRHYLKNNLKSKRTRGMAQVVHSLPSKCRDLSLNFSTSKERYNK
jgi:hypothetical protein